MASRSPSWRTIKIDPEALAAARSFIDETGKSDIALQQARDMAAVLRLTLELEEDKAETDVVDVVFAIKPKERETASDRLRASHLLRAFQEATGAGEFIQGRRGALTRIVWNCRSALAFASAALDISSKTTRNHSVAELAFGRIRVLVPADLTELEKRQLGEIAFILAKHE